jgi:hypothetical protein
MMLACVPAGVVLRMMNGSVVCEPSFDRVRDHGVWGVVRPYLASAGRAAARWPWKWKWAWPREVRDLAGKLAIVMGTSFAFAAAAPWLAGAVLVGQQRSYLGTTLEHAGGLAGAAAMLLGAYVWVSGLDFVARPSVTRKLGPAPLSFPPGLDKKEARDRLALNIYWRSCLGWARLFSVIYPWWFLLVLAASQSLDAALAVTVLFVFLMAAPLAVLVWLPSRLVERRLLPEKICAELCGILQPPAQAGTTPGGPGQGGAPGKPGLEGLISDPLGDLRGQVAQIAADLDDAAILLDRKQKRGLPPHPVATLMRAAAQSVRQYLGSQRSLHDALDDDMKDLLATMLMLFGERGDLTVYSRLAQQASAFSADGNPAVEVTRKPPGRLARLTGQMFAGIPKMSLTIASIATMAAIILAVVLALLHRVPTISLIQYLK